MGVRTSGVRTSRVINVASVIGSIPNSMRANFPVWRSSVTRSKSENWNRRSLESLWPIIDCSHDWPQILKNGFWKIGVNAVYGRGSDARISPGTRRPSRWFMVRLLRGDNVLVACFRPHQTTSGGFRREEIKTAKTVVMFIYLMNQIISIIIIINKFRRIFQFTFVFRGSSRDSTFAQILEFKMCTDNTICVIVIS